MAKWPLYHLTFPNNYLMGSTLLRFAENYESPKFRGKHFTLEEYMDWYASTHDDKFTYFEDWSGFNFPSHIIDTFNSRSTFYKGLSLKEELVMDQFSDVAGDFYVLGTVEGSDIANLSHEMVHALYYLNPVYAKAVDRLVGKEKKSLSPLLKWMKVTSGYHSSVHKDECNAYSCTGYPPPIFHRGGRATKKSRVLATKFKDLFEEHMGFPISKLEDEKWVKRKVHTIRMGPKLKKIKY